MLVLANEAGIKGPLVVLIKFIIVFHQLPALYLLGIPRPRPRRALCAAPGGRPRCGA